MFRNLLRPIRNRKGVALLMAIFATTLLVFLAVEVSYDTSVEYLVASQQVNRLRAYYAARAGLEINLLRILIYKKALAQFGQTLGANKSMLDPVWQIPFAWPPILPDELSSVDRDNILSAVENSSFDGQFLATIEAEGGKLDINDLGSEIKSLREATTKQILTIFETEKANNQAFQEKYYGFDFQELLNNIGDWIDEDQESRNGGGPENTKYTEFDNSEFIPPNAPLKTLDELNMIAGMNAEFFKLLAPRVTVFGVKGININYAPKEVLMALAPTMTEEAVAAVIARRSNPEEGGPFASEQDFFAFLQAERVDVTPIQNSKIPLYFDAVFNFRVRSTGQFANVTREIEAIVYDFENLKERYIEIVNKEEDTKTPGEEKDDDDDKGPGVPEGKNPGPPPKAGEEKAPKVKIPKGRPTLVFWKEN